MVLVFGAQNYYLSDFAGFTNVSVVLAGNFEVTNHLVSGFWLRAIASDAPDASTHPISRFWLRATASDASDAFIHPMITSATQVRGP